MQDNLIYTVYQIYIQNYFCKKSLLAVSLGNDSVVLLLIFNYLKLVTQTEIQLVSCNHFTQKANFYTLKEVYKISYLLQNRLTISCPIKLDTTENSNRIWRHQIFRRVLLLTKQHNIYLAHTQTDRIETILFNLLRGTTLNTFLSLDTKTNYKWVNIFYTRQRFEYTLRINRTTNNYFRPILKYSRNQIQCLSLKFQLPVCIDSTNFTLKMTRNKIRLILTPFIRLYFNKNIEQQIDKFARLSKSDLYYLDAITNSILLCIWKQHLIQSNLVKNQFVKLPKSLQFRLLYKLIYKYSGKNINFRSVKKLLTLIN